MSKNDSSDSRARGCHQKEGKPRRLLIVDDDPRLCRILARRLTSSFDALRTASSPKEAKRWLDTEEITHLIFDHNLGEGVPKGSELVPRWRREHGSIERAMLFTGELPDEAIETAGLDAIVLKTTDLYELMAALGL